MTFFTGTNFSKKNLDIFFRLNSRLKSQDTFLKVQKTWICLSFAIFTSSGRWKNTNFSQFSHFSYVFHFFNLQNPPTDLWKKQKKTRFFLFFCDFSIFSNFTFFMPSKTSFFSEKKNSINWKTRKIAHQIRHVNRTFHHFSIKIKHENRFL